MSSVNRSPERCTLSVFVQQRTPPIPEPLGRHGRTPSQRIRPRFPSRMLGIASPNFHSKLADHGLLSASNLYLLMSDPAPLWSLQGMLADSATTIARAKQFVSRDGARIDQHLHPKYYDRHHQGDSAYPLDLRSGKVRRAASLRQTPQCAILSMSFHAGRSATDRESRRNRRKAVGREGKYRFSRYSTNARIPRLHLTRIARDNSSNSPGVVPLGSVCRAKAHAPAPTEAESHQDAHRQLNETSSVSVAHADTSESNFLASLTVARLTASSTVDRLISTSSAISR